MMTEIDNALLYRSISLVRRLVERKREVGVFCNISASTLLDSGFFPQFIEFMEANTELAQTLFFEFPEQAIASLTGITNRYGLSLTCSITTTEFRETPSS